MSTVLIDGVATDRDAWLERRRRGIGASETPIVLGLKPSLLRLYLDKVGDLPPSDMSEEMEWGLRLEDDIVDAYQKRTGLRIASTQLHHAHPDSPHMIATLDGLTDCGRVVEFKSVGPHGAGKDLGDDGDSSSLPDSWVVQVNQQLAIAGALGVADGDRADVAVFGPGLRLRIYPLQRSEAVILASMEAIERFMEDHVLPGIPPEDICPDDARHLSRAFRRDSGEILTLGDDILHAAEQYDVLGREIRELERERDAAKARLLLSLGNAAGAELPGGWTLGRKVVTANYPARAAYTSEQIRLTVKRPKS